MVGGGGGRWNIMVHKAIPVYVGFTHSMCIVVLTFNCLFFSLRSVPGPSGFEETSSSISCSQG